MKMRHRKHCTKTLRHRQRQRWKSVAKTRHRKTGENREKQGYRGQRDRAIKIRSGIRSGTEKIYEKQHRQRQGHRGESERNKN